MKQWIKRYGPWIGLVAASAAYYPRFIKSDDLGMLLYPQAAQCLLDHQVLQTCAGPFTYPPGFAFVMIPLTLLPMGLRLLVWYLITIAATVCIYNLSERIASRLFTTPFSYNEFAWARPIGILLSLKFVLAVLENQAYDAFSLIFILVGLASLADGREKTGGAALGFAAAIKATPLIFLPYLLVKRRFVAAAAFAVVLLLVSYAPDLLFKPAGGAEGYFHAWLSQIAVASLLDPESANFAFWSGANALNHSLRGAVSLQINEVTHAGLHKLVLYGLDLAFIALAAALIMLRKAERNLIAIDGSILLIGALMLSPMTSRSHYFVLILPYVTLTMVMLRDQVTRGIGIAVLAISFFFLTATSNDVVGQTVSEWAYRHSFLVIGALTLMIYIAVIVWNPAVLREARPFVWQRAKTAPV